MTDSGDFRDGLDISNAPQLLWDDAVVDEAASTAERRLHEPSFAETVLIHDAPWEGDACNFHNILADCDGSGPLYRMYYLGWTMEEGAGWKRTGLVHPPCGSRVCYAESRDGLVWTKPNLGLREFEGSRENNVILDKTTDDSGEFFVFRDDNPDCTPEERYKGLSAKVPPHGPRSLRLFTSTDGIRFKYGRTLPIEGSFDSLNTAFFDPRQGLYHLYFRGLHRNDQERNGDCIVRDILRGDGGRTLESVELFGDQVDRPVPFENGSAAQFAGRPVVIEFDFFDADLYSFRFV